MKSLKRKKSRAIKHLLVGAGVMVLGWCLLYYSGAVKESVVESLGICGNVVIPALFPFMVIASFLAATPIGGKLARLITPITKYLYHAPNGAQTAILMSWVGGYPAGAKVLGVLREQGKISKEDCKDAVCFCVNSGPAFMVTMIGVGVFGSVNIGIRLFLCQIIASIVVARVVTWGKKREIYEKVTSKNTDLTYVNGLVHGVTTSAVAMLHICAFVLMSGSLIGILTATGAMEQIAVLFGPVMGVSHNAMNVLLTGLIEICSGTAMVQFIQPMEAIQFMPFLLSFTGVSVIAQVVACVGKENIDIARFIGSRILHGGVTQLLAWWWLKDSCMAIGTLSIEKSVLYYDQTTTIGTVVILAMCAMLFLLMENTVVHIKQKARML